MRCRNNRLMAGIILAVVFCGCTDKPTAPENTAFVGRSRNLKASCSIRAYYVDEENVSQWYGIGSGFALNDSVVVTAAHVVEAVQDRYNPSRLIIAFFPVDSIFLPIRKLATNPDYTVIRQMQSWYPTVSMVPDAGYLMVSGKTPAAVSLATTAELKVLVNNSPLYAIANRSDDIYDLLTILEGRFLYFTEQGLLSDAPLLQFHSTIVSYPGASGSPVFNDKGAVVGIIIGGGETYPYSLSVTSSSIVIDPFTRYAPYAVDWESP